MKILIVDDHPLIREGLSRVLMELDRKVEIVESDTASNALLAPAEHPDIALILLDLSVPGADGLSLLRALREKLDAVPVVVLSATDDAAVVRNAIDLGAMGFISKRSTAGILVNALRLVLAGGIYVPPQALSVGDAPQLPGTATSAALASSEGADILKRIGITPRQTEILALLVQGKPTKVICRDLGLSEGTVKTHIASILRALDARNRTQAVFTLSRLGVKFPALFASAPSQAGAAEQGRQS